MANENIEEWLRRKPIYKGINISGWQLLAVVIGDAVGIVGIFVLLVIH